MMFNNLRKLHSVHCTDFVRKKRIRSHFLSTLLCLTTAQQFLLEREQKTNKSYLISVSCFPEFSQQWIIKPVSVQRWITQWQRSGGWFAGKNLIKIVRSFCFTIRSCWLCFQFSAYYRHLRKRAMTKEAGKEKETFMTATARVSLSENL